MRKLRNLCNLKIEHYSCAISRLECNFRILRMCRISDCAEHMHYHTHTVKTMPVGWPLHEAKCTLLKWRLAIKSWAVSRKQWMYYITNFHINWDMQLWRSDHKAIPLKSGFILWSRSGHFWKNLLLCIAQRNHQLKLSFTLHIAQHGLYTSNLLCTYANTCRWRCTCTWLFLPFPFARCQGLGNQRGKDWWRLWRTVWEATTLLWPKK